MPTDDMSEEPEETMGARSADRQRRAFEARMRPCFDALYRTALRMTGERAAAEDLVQETCLKAYAAFDRFQSDGNFKAWVFRILTNAFVDAERKSARSAFVDIEDDVLEQVGALSPVMETTRRDPEIHVLYRAFRTEAFRAMASLSPEIRVVVALSLLEEFNYREIAELVGCPVGTVCSRLSRGRQQLQAALAPFVPEYNEAARRHHRPWRLRTGAVSTSREEPT